MKRILRRSITLVMGLAIILLLITNYILTGSSLRNEAAERFQYALDQLEQTLTENQSELNDIEEQLHEEYIRKTEAFAYMIYERPNVLENQDELERIRQLLDVDQVCVTDAGGVIQYSSNVSYIGMVFSEYEQTSFFLPILDDPTLQLVQGIEKNAADGEEFQYIGVSRIGEPGIVQIGMKPIRLLNAQERCTYPYLFSRIPTGIGQNVFAIDQKTQTILAHARTELVGQNMKDLPEAGQDFESCTEGGFLYLDGAQKYTVTRIIDGVIVGFSIPVDILYKNRLSQMAQIAFYLLVSGIIVIVVLNYLLNNIIIKSIQRINSSLAEIENGNMNVTISECSTPEFCDLSESINRMVSSLAGVSGKISRIINTTGVNFAAFEYDKETLQLMLTDRVQDILGMNSNEFLLLHQNGPAFLEHLKQLMRHPLEGEPDIYLLDPEKERWARIVISSDSHSVAGTITDISDDMKKRLSTQFDRDHDALTGLNNYRYFKEQVNSIRMNPDTQSFCAGVMIDLDHFKSINDTWGHDFGDAYLQGMAKLLRSLEKRGVITARRAGDEFCIFFFDWHSKEEIRAQIDEFDFLLLHHQMLFPDGSHCMIRASIGLAWAEPAEISFDSLMHNADNALYHAKRTDDCHYIEFEKKFEDRNEPFLSPI